jgi:hypothetical protein
MVGGEKRRRADAGDPESLTDQQTWFYSTYSGCFILL